MSIEVLLIPIGITAIAAIKESYTASPYRKYEATRIVDADVLLEALPVIGATVTSNGADRVTADSRWGKLSFQRPGSVFLGRADDGSEADTRAMLADLDSGVGIVMQNRTANLVVERAQALGFRLIEQRSVGGSLNYVFEEGA